MRVTNLEIMKSFISSGLRIIYRDCLASSKDEILASAINIKVAFSHLYPLTDKEWSEALRDIGSYADSLVLPEGERSQKNVIEYVVRGCVETTSYGKCNGRITIDSVIENVPDDEADFFGVYEVQEQDGARIERWIADFQEWDDAQMFALEKDKAEPR